MYEIFLKLIKERGLTAYKVAKDTGISNTTLSAWKNDHISISPKKLQILADYFGVSVDYLMGREPLFVIHTSANTTVPINHKAKPYVNEINDIAKKLNDENRLALLKFARYLQSQSE